MGYLEKARRVFALEQAELERLSARLDGSFEKTIDFAREALDGGRKIVVLGVGKSGHIGDKIAATLTSTGSRAVVLNSLNALHGDLGIVQDGDVVLALSYSGETDELLAVLPALRRFDIRLVAMTGNPRSALGTFSDVVLNVAVESEACPLGLAPTSSTTAMLVLGDAIAMVLLEARGFGREDFAKYHPAGRLGRRLLLTVRDIMRKDDRLPVAGPDTTVREALVIMNRLRAGAIVIADPADGRLAGIFTQGDFARRFQETAEVGCMRLRDAMTPNPVALPQDAPVADVLKLLEERQIDDVVAVNEARQPVGLVDSQDLARYQLL